MKQTSARAACAEAAQAVKGVSMMGWIAGLVAAVLAAVVLWVPGVKGWLAGIGVSVQGPVTSADSRAPMEYGPWAGIRSMWGEDASANGGDVLRRDAL